MRKTLSIFNENLLLMLSGQKKVEWRQFSQYNKKLLFKLNSDGKYEGNSEITEILFTAGHSPTAKKALAQISSIRLIKFAQNYSDPVNNFTALEEQFAIEIKIASVSEIL